MPRDPAPTPTPTRPSAHTLRYAADRRAELMVLLDRLAHARRRGLVPFERRTLPTARSNIRALNLFAALVLP